MPLVFLSPFKKTYSSSVCSLSTIIGLVSLITAILLPLFAAFSTEDFWLRLKEYTEQPLVDYSNHYMIYITKIAKKDVASGTFERYKTFFDSSSNFLNGKFEEICNNELNIYNDNDNIKNCDILKNGFITNIATDIDEDGINDKLTIKYEVTDLEIFNPENNNSYNIKQDIKIMFFLKYGLRKKVKLIMTPMLYINLPVELLNDNGNVSGKEIRLNGDLELIQKSPIVSTAVTSQLYYEENPFVIDYKDSAPFDLLYYYNKYKDNNYTVKYKYEKIEKPIQDKKIQITIEMNIPKMQQIFYIQSVFEAIKYAWMQYFYIFLPIYLILYIIFKFIIENNIFYSNIKSDL